MSKDVQCSCISPIITSDFNVHSSLLCRFALLFQVNDGISFYFPLLFLAFLVSSSVFFADTISTLVSGR